MAENLDEKTEEQEVQSDPEKRKKKRLLSSLYVTKDGKITRLRPTCERCGSGYFMADHGNRYTCGRCGFTRYRSPERDT